MHNIYLGSRFTPQEIFLVNQHFKSVVTTFHKYFNQYYPRLFDPARCVVGIFEAFRNGEMLELRLDESSITVPFVMQALQEVKIKSFGDEKAPVEFYINGNNIVIDYVLVTKQYQHTLPLPTNLTTQADKQEYLAQFTLRLKAFAKEYIKHSLQTIPLPPQRQTTTEPEAEPETEEFNSPIRLSFNSISNADNEFEPRLEAQEEGLQTDDDFTPPAPRSFIRL
jgi:hypothetical protein